VTGTGDWFLRIKTVAGYSNLWILKIKAVSADAQSRVFQPALIPRKTVAGRQNTSDAPHA